jgi:hypothetical protein
MNPEPSASVLCTEAYEIMERSTPVISAWESTNIPTTSLNADDLRSKLSNELLEQESNKLLTESENMNKLNIRSTNYSVFDQSWVLYLLV